MNKIIRMKDAKDLTGLSRSSIYLAMNAGTFPKAIKLGARSMGWLLADIQAWIDSRVSSCRADA